MKEDKVECLLLIPHHLYKAFLFVIALFLTQSKSTLDSNPNNPVCIFDNFIF